MIGSTVKGQSSPLEIVNDPLLLKRTPMSQYEYVDVVFGPLNTDTAIPYSILAPEDPETIRWIDITPNTVGTSTPAFVYRETGIQRAKFTAYNIVLRATQTGYTTRLLLFLERT